MILVRYTLHIKSLGTCPALVRSAWPFQFAMSSSPWLVPHLSAGCYYCTSDAGTETTENLGTGYVAYVTHSEASDLLMID